MNVKHLTALLLLSASAGTVLADTDTPWNPPAGSALTRAEVVADLQQDHSQHWQANGDAEYPMLPAVQSGKTRQQVEAELQQENSQHWQASGDAEYPVLPVVQSGKSRQQVEAELQTAQGPLIYNSLYRGS